MLASTAPRKPQDRGGDVPLQFGKYQLLRLLARGGMGEVYLARLVGELGFEKQLVIKTILPEFAAKPRFVEMFADEAKTAVELSHGNIVPTYELGRNDDTFYIVMGYVDGPSVAQLLTCWHRAKRPPSLHVALHIVRGVLGGLAYAHRDDHGRAAVVHRDISPRNVLLERSGQVRIVDFGISARAREQVDMRAGSIGYMAPEQARGEAADPRADVFSTACLLYALVTGESPFPKEGVWSQPDFTPIPDELREPTERALSFEPSDRPEDAGAFLRLLAPAMHTHVAAFGDPELAAHLAEAFPNGWHPRSEPASAGNTRLFDGPGQTFATRLTTITSVEPSPSAPNEDLTPLPFAAEASDSATGPAPPAQPRHSWRFVAMACLLVTGVGLGMQIARRSQPAPLRTWTTLAPAVLRVAARPATEASPASHLQHAFVVEPADATVRLDGRVVIGASPYTLSTSPGHTRVLTVTKAGYLTQRFVLKPTSPWPTQVSLLPDDAKGKTKPKDLGYLRVLAPAVPWAEVVVDGRTAGHTPTRSLPLSAGRHRVEVRCIPEACPTPMLLLSTTVNIAAAETYTVEASTAVTGR